MPARKGETISTSHTGSRPRIGGACIACRARKRKCSGEQPICDQCKHSKTHCEWPRPQKRGIPKHLIRKYETRLARMESLLRLTLSFVSDDQLESALQVTSHSTSIDEWKNAADPGVWELYPLVSLEDVRAWQARSTPAPVTRHRHRSRMLSIHGSILEDGLGQSGEHYTDDSLILVEEDCRSFEGTTGVGTDADTGSYPFTHNVSTSTATGQSQLDAGGVQNNRISPNSISLPMNDAVRHNSPPGFSLSEEFKKEFLW
ncbi:hypothetical protein GGR58DRAFT_480566 [Xylaria digitata]|nr:hypothetical protein GGR58DRAFT_480566 [Xylaria digitata]